MNSSSALTRSLERSCFGRLVKEAREKELKCLREHGENDKVDERAAVATSPQLVDTDNAFEEEPKQLRSRIVARGFKSGDSLDLYAGTPPLEALKATGRGPI